MLQHVHTALKENYTITQLLRSTLCGHRNVPPLLNARSTCIYSQWLQCHFVTSVASYFECHCIKYSFAQVQRNHTPWEKPHCTENMLLSRKRIEQFDVHIAFLSHQSYKLKKWSRFFGPPRITWQFCGCFRFNDDRYATGMRHKITHFVRNVSDLIQWEIFVYFVVCRCTAVSSFTCSLYS